MSAPARLRPRTARREQSRTAPRTTTSIVAADKAVTVAADSEFSRAITGLIAREQIRTVIETGTYFGTGTTATIARALIAGGDGGICYTIEVNPRHHAIALQHLRRDGLLTVVRPLLGLSVPRAMLPTPEEIQRATIADVAGSTVIVDHDESDRVARYMGETHNLGVPDNLLAYALQCVEYTPGLVLLDSGGHLGYVEFQYLLQRLTAPTFIALDDIRHVKHAQSWAFIKRDPRFKVLVESGEKFGFGIARYTPAPLVPRRLLWIRTDAVGDTIWASGMLAAVRRHWPKAHITVLCNSQTHPLLEVNPAVDQCMVIDKERAFREPEYLQRFCAAIRSASHDLVLVSHFSRETLIDLLAQAAGAPVIGYDGNENLYHTGEKALTDSFYTKLVPAPTDARHELARHRHFLTSLGIPAGDLPPMITVTDADRVAAAALYNRHGLTPERTIVLVAGVGRAHRVYTGYGAAIGALCREHGFKIAAVGTSTDRELVAANLRGLEDISVDLTGQTALRELAAFVGEARMVVGAETGTTNMASALGVPTVVLMGGGDFGRFLPATPRDVIACLPLACYGCGWKCTFEREHCIRDAMPDVLGAAFAAALAGRAATARVFVPAKHRITSRPDLPPVGDVREWLGVEIAEIIEVDECRR